MLNSCQWGFADPPFRPYAIVGNHAADKGQKLKPAWVTTIEIINRTWM
jgi:hypothetical protein